MRKLVLAILAVLLMVGPVIASHVLWVTLDDKVQRWDDAGNFIDSRTVPTEGAGWVQAKGVIQDPHTGEMIVATQRGTGGTITGGALYAYDKATGALSRTIRTDIYTGSTSGYGIYGITFGDDGDLYAARYDSIHKFDGLTFADKGVSGSRLAVTGSTAQTAVKDGKVYEGIFGSSNYSVPYYSSTTGALLGSLAGGAIRAGGPGVLIGPDGLLYVGNAASEIYRWDISQPSPPAPVVIFGNTGLMVGESILAWNTEKNWLSAQNDPYKVIRACYDDGVAPALPWVKVDPPWNHSYHTSGPNYHAWGDPLLIPEPATLMVLALGAVAGLIRRR